MMLAKLMIQEKLVMKRDMNLIREFMLKLEDSDYVLILPQDLRIAGFTDNEIQYHGYLLVNAGFAEGKLIEVNDGRGESFLGARTLSSLTWEGQEFLSSIKNDSVWLKTMEFIKEKGGSAPFTTVALVASSILKSHFGLL
jgi:Hypothetical protein (DUF2513)